MKRGRLFKPAPRMSEIQEMFEVTGDTRSGCYKKYREMIVKLMSDGYFIDALNFQHLDGFDPHGIIIAHKV